MNSDSNLKAQSVLDGVVAPRAKRATEENRLESLSQIERVLSLQAVGLFRSCQTEEIVRLASISSVVELAAGEQVYASGAQAMALYCVVEGEVQVTGEDGTGRLVGERELFGMLEILSGRLRQRGAHATRRALVLSITAEDFFDLLSNNVEIAKALFREILALSEVEAAARRLEGPWV